MAAYRWVYGFGHLRVDCQGPGSALEARFKYGTIHLPRQDKGVLGKGIHKTVTVFQYVSCNKIAVCTYTL